MGKNQTINIIHTFQTLLHRFMIHQNKKKVDSCIYVDISENSLHIFWLMQTFTSQTE